MWDCVIIGKGPAGLSAATYAARAGLGVLVLGGKSKLEMAKVVENYFGFAHIAGTELLRKGMEQARKAGAAIKEEEVIALKHEGTNFIVESATGTYKSKSIIIATGISIKELGIKGEKQFSGKGVHQCAVCDGYFYKGKGVIVVGNGDFAAHEALELANNAKKTCIFTNGADSRISKALLKKLKSKKIPIRKERIIEIKGKNFVEGIVLENKRELKADGIFIALGVASAFDFAKRLGIEMKGNYIAADNKQHTNIKGIFAAGDCCGGMLQVCKASADGAVAAMSAIAYIRGE